MRAKNLKNTAVLFSGLFNPFLIPFIGFMVLFLFSYLRIMPAQYKLIILGVVYCFTILMPIVSIRLFLKINKLSEKEAQSKKSRLIAYLLTIIAYAFCCGLLYRMYLPPYVTGIILGSLIAIGISMLVSLVWKISEHMVGMGGIIGGLVSFGYLFHFNPVTWLCILILITGLVGTSRMILGKHTFTQLLAGWVVGFASLITAILII